MSIKTTNNGDFAKVSERQSDHLGTESFVCSNSLFPLNELQLLLNQILEQPHVNGISIQLFIPKCPPIDLKILNVDKCDHGDWEVDESRLNITGKVLGKLTYQDVCEVLHEIGHVYARHALGHSSKGFFADVALLKEERWCWEFAHSVGNEAGLITNQSEFWNICVDLSMSYYSAMVQHSNTVNITPDQFQYYTSRHGYNSTPPFFGVDQSKEVAKLKFGNIQVW